MVNVLKCLNSKIELFATMVQGGRIRISRLSFSPF